MERKIKINGVIPGHPQGSVETVQCDDEGTPLEFFWRRQLKHAKQDGCCEFVVEEKKPAKNALESLETARSKNRSTRK